MTGLRARWARRWLNAFAPVAATVLTELDEVARLLSARDLATTTRVLRALMDLGRDDI